MNLVNEKVFHAKKYHEGVIEKHDNGYVYVRFDSEPELKTFRWPTKDLRLMGWETMEEAIERFKQGMSEEVRQKIENAEPLRQGFAADFPVDKIRDLTKWDYMIASEGKGNDRSFCRRLQFEMAGSMGRASKDWFGVYHKDDCGETWDDKSIWLRGFSGVDDRFEAVKKEIVDLLKIAESCDLEAIQKCRLNRIFRDKLLSVYYPKQFIPVFAKDTVKGYCDAVGVMMDENQEDPIYHNQALLAWKNSHQVFSQWSNVKFMFFCDMLWREKQNNQSKKLYGCHQIQGQAFAQIVQIQREVEQLPVEGLERQTVAKIRINQGVFRERLWERYGKCCLCDVSKKELLIASHIKPWSQSGTLERTDAHNGLLLCPNHDRLFDGGWITFGDDGKIRISQALDAAERKAMGVDDTMTISVQEENKKYMEFHREHIFKT